MATFIGEYNVKIDTKGRFVVPVAFMRQLDKDSADECFILKEDLFEKCLCIYPYSEWDRQNSIIREKINPFERQHNQFLRSFSKGAVEVSLDSTNRILIPKRLMDYAQIRKDIVLSGQDGKIEIWSAESYEQHWDNAPDFESLAKNVLNS